MPEARKRDDREVFSAEDLPDDLLEELQERIEAASSCGVVETDFEVVRF